MTVIHIIIISNVLFTSIILLMFKESKVTRGKREHQDMTENRDHKELLEHRGPRVRQAHLGLKAPLVLEGLREQQV